MTNDCGIIKDLLPLYIEGIAGKESKEFIENHIENCEECKKLLSEIQKNIEIEKNIIPLKNLKRNLRKKNIYTVLATVSVVLVVVSVIFLFMTAPIYIPYSADLLSISENINETQVTFDEKVTNISIEWSLYRSDMGEDMIIEKILPGEPYDEREIYHAHTISAWTTHWNKLVGTKGNVIITNIPNWGKNIENPELSTPNLLYYSSNDGTNDVLIHGDPKLDNFGYLKIMKSYQLIYNFFFVLSAVIILSVLLLIFRKKPRTKRIIISLLFVPFSYSIAHLLVKGFTVISYSIQSDLSAIIFLTTVLFLIGLFCMNLIKIKKDTKIN